ncbi:hypothetical protein MAR_009714 [Mya arenaria]|uniref:Uncharacterized protein n=1 Tax=Mya arenaria TaxID=6604 RepID=A0ABY7E2J6_MYAAR|nr:hypothetical protein MAR_009714 [Mya arenaria]
MDVFLSQFAWFAQISQGSRRQRLPAFADIHYRVQERQKSLCTTLDVPQPLWERKRPKMSLSHCGSSGKDLRYPSATVRVAKT